MLAVSLDGRLAPPAGGAAQLGGPGDRRALEEALAWADGALVGAQTLRLHGSTCLIHAPDLLESRRLRGLDPQPLALAVSRSGQLPAELPFFRQPLQRWLLGPGGEGGGDRDAPATPPGFARQLAFDDWRALLSELARLGLGRLLLLGGAQLAASLLAEDLVEELQLTVCPMVLGGNHTWLPSGCTVPPGGPWHLIESRGLGDGELLLRYRRGPQGAGGRPPI